MIPTSRRDTLRKTPNLFQEGAGKLLWQRHPASESRKSRGYKDGYNTRHQYGSDSNGSYSMLGAIVSQILNLQELR